MGLFNVQMEIGDRDGRRFETIEALVDSGAAFSSVPASALASVGVVPHRRMRLSLADGNLIERDFGWARVRLNGESELSPVIFGDDGDAPLLGAVALELFSLGIDPVNRRLIPVAMRA